jgi:uncharacterized protein YwgA
MTLDANGLTALKETVQAIGSIFAMGISIYAIIRSSKQKQNEAIAKAQEHQTEALDDISIQLTEHILEDAKEISTLKTEVKNLHENLSSKLDEIIRRV